jgi:photosystem II stability/assembly factor-like uncharacterized protein
VTVVTPPPRTDPGERSIDERVTELEALIEEARQRARRRRRQNAAIALAMALAAGAAVYAGRGVIDLGPAGSAEGDRAFVGLSDRDGSWSVPTGVPGFAGIVVLHPSEPGVVFLTAGGRAFRSTDGGRSWSVGSPIAAHVDAPTADPRDGSTLYAGTSDGVFKSTDAGRSWRNVRLAPPEQLSPPEPGWVFDVVVDPGGPRVVYARTPSVVWRSTDAGATWTRLLVMPENRSVTAFAVDPSAPGTLYAATQPRWAEDGNGHTPIMKSTDGGATWRTVARARSYGTTTSFTFDPRPDTIWATGTGLLVTRDGGTTWSEPGRPPGRNLGPMVVDPGHPGTIYVSAHQRGLFRSTDDGASWQPFAAGDAVDGLVIDARRPGTMYVNDGRGIAKSTDGGATWVRADAGIVASSVTALALAPSSAATIYAGGLFGLSRSDDRGRTWTRLLRRSVWSVAVDPRDPRHVLVIARNDTLIGTRGILVSYDAGANWITPRLPPQRKPRQLDGTEPPAVAFDTRRPGVVYIGTRPGVLRSSDGGRRWRWADGRFEPETPLPLAVHPTRGGTLYAYVAAENGGRVARSTDAGSSWRFGSFGDPSAYATSLAIAPSRPETLYAATNVGLARSVDGGNTWRLQPAEGLTRVAVDPTDADTVYGGTASAGVLRSTDGGASWQPFGEGLPSQSISTLAFDAAGTMLYAGTNGAGLTSIRVR